MARLQHFYGGDPAGWLEMPLPIVDAYASMLPVLRAEEQLRAINAVAAGTGSMKQHDLRAYVRGLERDARTTRAAQKASPADLASMGIRVKEVVKRV